MTKDKPLGSRWKWTTGIAKGTVWEVTKLGPVPVGVLNAKCVVTTLAAEGFRYPLGATISTDFDDDRWVLAEDPFVTYVRTVLEEAAK